MKRKILVTGGAGFIGSHLLLHLVPRYPDYQFVNLDALTYAGNPDNIAELEGKSNYRFQHGDIRDTELVKSLFDAHDFDGVIHLAAESHVDRSIEDPTDFITTNVIGTVNLLNAAKAHWAGNFDGKLFYHVSTDEVYGSLGATGLFREDTPYDPRSPYSASKASSDHFVRAYYHTYGLPIVMSNCSNNYGPLQFPEKLIPLMIDKLKREEPLPVYGDGSNVRDWLWVGDHCTAIDQIFHHGQAGETYNIGGLNERRNIDLVHQICALTDELLGRPEGSGRQLITFVADRLGHDKRYAIDSSKLRSELGWQPKVDVEEGLRKTVAWYLENESWLERIRTGAYRQT
ncbi:MAG: dTDP-glucose 4,6-dehydratase [Bacteroidota bacterium]